MTEEQKVLREYVHGLWAEFGAPLHCIEASCDPRDNEDADPPSPGLMHTVLDGASPFDRVVTDRKAMARDLEWVGVDGQDAYRAAARVFHWED